LRKKYRKKRKSLKRSKKNKVKILSLFELVPSLWRRTQAKKASKEARKDRGQDFVLCIKLAAFLERKHKQKSFRTWSKKNFQGFELNLQQVPFREFKQAKKAS
jgi:hypothetical protein